jgi:dTDP-4-dehydrorhamnose reductase
MKVAIIGANGQLGNDLVRVFSQDEEYEVQGLTRENLDVTDVKSLRVALGARRPDVVINTAAFCMVDDCEDKPEEAFRVNAIGALNAARVCTEIGAVCVYISTDYVFAGEKEGAYTEEDRPCPINVYGASKLAGEHLVQQAARRWAIVRVASLFGVAGARGKGRNFVETILEKARSGGTLRVVGDIRMSPTYAVDAARALERIVRSRATGVFHAANGGQCSWYEFASTALTLAALPAAWRASAGEYRTRARRPANSALASVKLSAAARTPLRSWQEALGAYLQERNHTTSASAG